MDRAGPRGGRVRCTCLHMTKRHGPGGSEIMSDRIEGARCSRNRSCSNGLAKHLVIRQAMCVLFQMPSVTYALTAMAIPSREGSPVPALQSISTKPTVDIADTTRLSPQRETSSTALSAFRCSMAGLSLLRFQLGSGAHIDSHIAGENLTLHADRAMGRATPGRDAVAPEELSFGFKRAYSVARPTVLPPSASELRCSNLCYSAW